MTEMKQEKKEHLVIAMNLGDHASGGFHWVAIYVFLGKPRPFMYYFDSAKSSKTPPESVEALHTRWQQELNDNSFLLQTNKKQQQFGNNNCGVYVLYVLTLMASPLNEPLGMPILPPSQGQSDTDPVLHPTFQSQQEKMTKLDTMNLPDETVQYYRSVFFS